MVYSDLLLVLDLLMLLQALAGTNKLLICWNSGVQSDRRVPRRWEVNRVPSSTGELLHVVRAIEVYVILPKDFM
jgi:hypothetical protein